MCAMCRTRVCGEIGGRSPHHITLIESTCPQPRALISPDLPSLPAATHSSTDRECVRLTDFGARPPNGRDLHLRKINSRFRASGCVGVGLVSTVPFPFDVVFRVRPVWTYMKSNLPMCFRCRRQAHKSRAIPSMTSTERL